MESSNVPIVIQLNDEIVFLSHWLEKMFPDFFQRLTNLFDELLIQWFCLPATNDIWCRDFMPFAINNEQYLQYKYYPDYLLKKASDRYYITDSAQICKKLNLPCITTDLVIDGGNMVKAGNYLIMTEKVFQENPDKSVAEVTKELEDLTQLKLLILPWDKAEKYGHSDGIVRPINDKTVLMTNYADFDKDIAHEMKKRLQAHFDVKTLEYKVRHLDARSWVYINYLEVGNTIIIPALGIPEDKQAFTQIKRLFPYKRVAQIRMEEVVKHGGALNCISWTIDRNFLIRLKRRR